jgi:hypothetical protein
VGNGNHVVSHKLCGFQGHVGRRIVVVKAPVVVAPEFQFFVTYFLSAILKCHSMTKSQELTVVIGGTGEQSFSRRKKQ